MQTPASIRKHLFTHDLIFMYTSQPAWSVVAFWTMVGGVVGALMAAVPGFIDYLSIQDRRIGRIATIHMVLNLTAVLLFVLNLGIRWNRPLTPSSAILLSWWASESWEFRAGWADRWSTSTGSAWRMCRCK